MKLRLALFLPVLASVLALAPNAFAAAPANDNIAAATNITTTATFDDPTSTETDRGSNAEATAQTDEPQHADVDASHSEWFKFTPASNGEAIFIACDSDFDTVMSVYQSSNAGSPTMTNITSEAENDNNGGCGTGSTGSAIQMNVLGGHTYFVAIDGNGPTETGNISFGIAYASAPANDDFANRVTLTGSPTSAPGDNIAASHETGEPDHDNADTFNSVWYQWTAPSTGNFTVDTCTSDYDTVLGVYTGSAVNALTEVGSNDDACGTSGLASAVAFHAVGGTAYQIAVDGFEGNEGTFTLHIGPTPVVTPPPGGGNTTPPPPVLAPAITALKLGSAKLKTVLKKGLGVTFGCDKACSAKFVLEIPNKTAKGLHLAKVELAKKKKPVVIGKGSGKLTAAGTKKATVKLTKKAKKRLKKLKKGKKVKATLITTVTGNNGLKTVKKKTVTLKR